jgi:hypothetical protein
MESTYSTTREKVQVKPATKAEKISTEGQVSRSALKTFIAAASIVFALAIYYCYSTKHFEGAIFLSVAAVFIAIYAVTTYKSFK